MCTRFLEKDLPPSLSVDDIRASAHSGWIPRALRSPILVLVAGDVARPISAEYRDALGREGTPTRFLYAGAFKIDGLFAQTDTSQRRVRIREESGSRLATVRGTREGVRSDRVLQLVHRFLTRRTRLCVATPRHRPRGVQPTGATTNPFGVAAGVVLEAVRVVHPEERGGQHLAGGTRQLSGCVLRKKPPPPLAGQDSACPRPRRGRAGCGK